MYVCVFHLDSANLMAIIVIPKYIYKCLEICIINRIKADSEIRVLKA